MIKKVFTGLCLCMLVFTASLMLGNCSGESESILGTVKGMDIRSEEGIETALSLTACQEFQEMVNGFTLTIREDDEEKAYDNGWFFRVEDENGKETSIQFFDNILSINDDRYYDITEKDYGSLQDFCKKYDVAGAPDLVLSSKAYLESIDYDNVIDYSYYAFSEIEKLDKLKQIGAAGGITEENMNQYCLASLGDLMDESPIESGQLYLLLEKKTGKVVWYEAAA